MRTKLSLLATITGVALWQMAAIQPASADAVSDLQSQVTALQNKVNALSSKSAPENKDYPGFWNLPGTNTWMTFAGHVKLDAEYDHRAYDGPQADFGNIPLEGTTGYDRTNSFHANTKQTYLYLETHTPTKYGDLEAHISWDFYLSGQGNPNISNSYAFRLRNAYGVLGNWTFGQDWSAFQDLGAGPNTIDFNGPAGQTFIRQPQLRYTKTIGDNQYIISLENSVPDYTAPPHYYNANVNNTDQDGAQVGGVVCYIGDFTPCFQSPSGMGKIPDIILRWQHNGSFGHVSFQALARKIDMSTGYTGTAAISGSPTFPVDFPSNFAPVNTSTWGYGFSFTGALNLNTLDPKFGNDNIVWQAAGGPGIGRYLQDLLFNGAILNNNTHQLDKLFSWGGFIGYEHFWNTSGTWESNLVLGAEGTRLKDMSQLLADQVQMTNHSESLHLNLLWHPVSNTTFGIEYMWGRRNVGGFIPATQTDHGYFNRYQFSAIYNF